MATGDVAASINHGHENRADGEWRNHPGPSNHNRATNGENEKKGPDEFCDVFVHGLFFGLLRLLWIEKEYWGKRDEASGFAFQNLACFVIWICNEATGASRRAEIGDDCSGNFLAAMPSSDLALVRAEISGLVSGSTFVFGRDRALGIRFCVAYKVYGETSIPVKNRAGAA